MIGQKIREYRKKNKMTMRDLANKSGISNSYISDLENGKNNKPSLDVTNKIATALDVSINDLLGYEERRNIEVNQDIDDLIKNFPQYKVQILDTLNFVNQIFIHEVLKPSNIETADTTGETLTANLNLYLELFKTIYEFSNVGFIVSSKDIEEKNFPKIYSKKEKKIKAINSSLDKIFKNYLIRYNLIDEPVQK